MKTSVIIIAHNEEKHIEKCIDSVLAQTQKPDEVVLVAHNCTDKTIEVAQKYPIVVIPFEGKRGTVYARMKGLDSVSGEVILCIDGDSTAEKNWISEMVPLLKRDVVLAGSWVKLSGGIYYSFSNFFNKRSCLKRDNATHWIWGASFAFLGRDKEKVREAFLKSIEISEKINLNLNPDDYILALYMKRYGSLMITNKTFVTANMKEQGLISEIKRSIENIMNRKKVERFLKKSS
jgi:glycosyltransferase involved in cell wall biosynthesis